MRNRLRAVRGARHTRRRSSLLSALTLGLFLSVGFFGSAWLSEAMRAANDTQATIQLVRLSLTATDGSARIEVIADGALSETAVERFTRASETIIRIRGARSFLRPAYSANDIVMRNIRISAGDAGGEPFVDIIIPITEGDAIASRRNFNRLVIGITNEAARLRRQAETNTQARLDPSSPRAVSIDSAPVTDAIASDASRAVAARGAQSRNGSPYTTSESATPETQAVNTSAALPAILPAQSMQTNYVSPVQAVAQAVAASSGQEPTFSFRGRTIWLASAFGSPVLSRLNLANVPVFFWNGANSATTPDFAGGWSYIPMTLEAPGRVPGQWIPGTTAATRDEIGGHPFGAGVLRPSIALGAMFDDNFFYRSPNGEDLGIFTLAPRLEYEIPGETRALRLMYEARLNRLSNGNWANGQTFDADARANLGRSVRVAFRDHLVRSALDPREFDPAGEVYIVGDTFLRNDGAARVEFLLSPRSRVAFGTGYNIVQWSDDHIAGAPLFINYNELYTDATYERDISESTTATVTASFANTNTTDPLRPEFNRLGGNYRYQFEVGARTQISETNGFAFRAGYERTDFRRAPLANDYNTLVFDLLYRRDLTERLNFELAALRKTQVSTFNLEGGNARLLSTGGRARLEGRMSDALKLGLGLNYQQLSFPIAVVPDSTASGGVFVGQFAGERRKDHLYGFSFDASYRLTELVNSRFVYSFIRRDSTLPVLTYNRNRLSLVFEFGRRNKARGRPF